MPIKYQCPKCGRRFVDWGAEKLGFMCPDDEGVELVRVGTGDDASPSPRRSSSKKAPRRVAATPIAVGAEDEVEDPNEFEPVAAVSGDDDDDDVVVADTDDTDAAVVDDSEDAVVSDDETTDDDEEE